MSKLRSLAVVLATAPTLAGCLGEGDVALDSTDPETAVATQPLYGIEGTFEYALDAPWRLDPVVDANGNRTYPRIPLQISFFDEYLWDRDTCYGTICPGGIEQKRLGDFCVLSVRELRSNGALTGAVNYGFAALADAERTYKGTGDTGAFWPFPDEAADLPTRAVCQPNSGIACPAGMRRIQDTSEWHARADHAMVRNPGDRVTLRLEAQVSKVPGGCSDLENRIAFVNWVNVEFGRDPLPRFSGDDRWLYADLHYHSQGTDNEGEVGYNFRGTLAAQSAIGVDVIFSTDHASSAEQIVDADVIGDNIWELGEESFEGARDMTARRFATARDGWLEGAGGVNPSASTIWPYARPVEPRIFLGGEVDVIPTVDQKPTTSRTDANGILLPDPESAWLVPYGNPNYGQSGLRFDLIEYCDGWSFDVTDLCPGDRESPDEMFTARLGDDGVIRYRVHDVQGLNETSYYGRQHLLYLPRSSSTADGFVASNTTRYGGASRDLADGPFDVADEIESKNGIAFLAHPLSGGGSSKGPGMVPYTWSQLRKAFRERSIAGLQLWNENERLKAGPGDDAGDWTSTGYSLIDFPSDGSGHTNGWVDEHFELVPVWDKETWTWQEQHESLDFALHHGAYTWDEMLRWGLDRTVTESIAWLPSGEPRKVFMAGGSDAHGDFNYRRTGYFVGPDGTNNDALGAVRNLVLAAPGGGAAPTQDQFVDALAGGRFSVTDGPAIRIAIDRNGNGVYDDDDLNMGDTVYLDGSEVDTLPLVVDWESTADFGPISKIDLYIGVSNDATQTGVFAPTRTYAPVDHGVRREQGELTPEQIDDGWLADPVANDCGTGVCAMNDGYFLPAAGPARDALRINPTSTEAMSGMRAITLDLTKYPPRTYAGRRFYIRAFAKTRPDSPACGSGGLTEELAKLQGRCIRRYAYANPVWAITRNFSGVDCPYEPNSLDRDLDGYPDLCDGDPDVPNNGGWSRQAGGTSSDHTTAVVQDSTGAVVSGGHFMGTIEIDGASTLTTPFTNLRDGYVVKYDATGQHRWSVQLGGDGHAQVNDLAIEPSTDHVVVTGTFTGQLLVDGATTMWASAEDSFVMKIDGATGAVIWHRQMTGPGNQTASSIAFDSTNRVVVGGTFRNEVRYLPWSSRLVGDATDDCVVAFYSSSIGTYMSSRKVSGSGNCKGNDVATGPSNRIYLVGQFTGELIPDPVTNLGGTMNSDGGTDAFLIAFDGSDYAWDWYLGGVSGAGNDAWLTAAAVDADGSVVVGGHFQGYLFQNSALLAGSLDQLDMFVVRFAATGSRLRIRQYGGTGNDKLYDLDVSAAGVALGGLFASPTITFGGTTLDRTYAYEGFAAILDGDLLPLWADDFAFQDNSLVYATDLADDGSLGLAGQFYSLIKVDQTHQMWSRGQSDGYAARIRPLP